MDQMTVSEPWGWSQAKAHLNGFKHLEAEGHGKVSISPQHCVGYSLDFQLDQSLYCLTSWSDDVLGRGIWATPGGAQGSVLTALWDHLFLMVVEGPRSDSQTAGVLFPVLFPGPRFLFFKCWNLPFLCLSFYLPSGMFCNVEYFSNFPQCVPQITRRTSVWRHRS